jgi:uncharacterized membrane protein YfcA
MLASASALALSNPQVANKLLAAAGYAAGLGQMDVRELSQTRIPVWAVVAVSAAVGVAGGIWLARRLPEEWIVRRHHER